MVTGGQTTFGIQFDASAGLAYTGKLSFTNNFADRNPFNFTVIGTSVQLTLAKTASSDTVIPGQTLTYTLVISNGGATNVTNALVSDTLPVGLSLAGPTVIDPPGAGTPGTPPTLVSDLTISAGQRITVTFPVTVDTGVASGTVITNTAAVTSTEVTTPLMNSVEITVRYYRTQLPLILKGYTFAP